MWSLGSCVCVLFRRCEASNENSVFEEQRASFKCVLSRFAIVGRSVMDRDRHIYSNLLFSSQFSL